MRIVQKAREFAERVHEGHVRTDAARTPYILHLQEVAQLVEESGGSQQEIAAAWLHDTVEDTEATIEDIQNEFGDEIARLVEGLTDKTEWMSLSLGERKAKQAERVAKEPGSVKRVKLADQTSNVKIVSEGKDHFTLEEKFIYIESAKKIAEACSGVSAMLDELFLERYEEARNQLTKKDK